MKLTRELTLKFMLKKVSSLLIFTFILSGLFLNTSALIAQDSADVSFGSADSLPEQTENVTVDTEDLSTESQKTQPGDWRR